MSSAVGGADRPNDNSPAFQERGLGSPLLDAINHEFDCGGWLRALMSDPELFFAIRKRRANFYYRGASVIELYIDQATGRLVGKSHYKYLVKPDFSPEYVQIEDGHPKFDAPQSSYFLTSVADTHAMKSAINDLAGREKEGVHKLIRKTPHVLDVEVALTVEGAKNRNVADRLDFVTIEQTGSEANLAFFEAKHFTNAELRAKGQNEAPVVGQMMKYESALKRYQHSILESYRKVVKELLLLKGLLPDRRRALSSLDAIAKWNVVTEPRLVIFGFDQDQREGLVWKKHLAKFAKLEQRPILIGDPANAGPKTLRAGRGKT